MALTQLQLTYLSCFWESLFLGIHFVLIAVVAWLWTSRKSAGRVHFMLYVSLILMFLIACAHTCLNVAVWILPKVLGQNVKAIRASVLLAIFQFMFGDFVIIWRTWVVWNKNYWVIVAPVCISCSAFGIAFFTVKESQVFQDISPSLLVANFMLCTFLIIGRIFYVSFQSSGSQNVLSTVKKTPYKGVILLLAESGAIYTAVQTTSLILHKKNSPILHVFLNLMVPLMGLLPSIIVVLAALDALPGSNANSSRNATTLETARFNSRVGKSTGFRSGTLTRDFNDDTDIEIGSWKEENTHKMNSTVNVAL